MSARLCCSLIALRQFNGICVASTTGVQIFVTAKIRQHLRPMQPVWLWKKMELCVCSGEGAKFSEAKRAAG